MLIADDHPLVRSGLTAALAPDSSIVVLDAVGTGSAALESALRLQPDVVVMDLQMPDLNGIEVTRRLTAEAPGIAVLILTMYEDDGSLFAAMRAGARGYLLKGAKQDEIVSAIRAVSHGGAVFGTSVARRVLAHFSSTGATPATFPQLTEREHEVLDLVAAGLDNAAIGRRLHLSTKTVSNHFAAIFAKPHVDGRPQAIVRARESGLRRG